MLGRDGGEGQDGEGAREKRLEFCLEFAVRRDVPGALAQTMLEALVFWGVGRLWDLCACRRSRVCGMLCVVQCLEFWVKKLHDAQCAGKDARLNDLELDLICVEGLSQCRPFCIYFVERDRQFTPYSHEFDRLDIVVLEEEDQG